MNFILVVRPDGTFEVYIARYGYEERVGFGSTIDEALTRASQAIGQSIVIQLSARP